MPQTRNNSWQFCAGVMVVCYLFVFFLLFFALLGGGGGDTTIFENRQNSASIKDSYYLTTVCIIHISNFAIIINYLESNKVSTFNYN